MRFSKQLQTLKYLAYYISTQFVFFSKPLLTKCDILEMNKPNY